MSKVILTIDCDFVYDKLLGVVNDSVFSEGASMKGFIKSLERSKNYKVYREHLLPNMEKSLFVNKLIEKHIARRKPIIYIKEHHEILKDININDDVVINVDYHEDVDNDMSGLFCGNWANNVKNYYWTSEVSDFVFDMDYDILFLCYSPEWTPDVKFIENLYVRKRLEVFEEI